MQVQIVDNRERKLLSMLEPAFGEADEIRIATAFASRRGIDLVRPALERALSSGATVEFLVGMDMNATEPTALHHLNEWARQTRSVELYCFASLKDGLIYHPKIYLAKNGSRATVVIGSSNLTIGGLKSNLEANVVLEGDMGEEPISDSFGAYSDLKFLPGRVIPSEDLLNIYEGICKETKRVERDPSSANSLRELKKRFREEAATLRRPVATSADLTGWLELVYDSLLKGEFTNTQAYARKAEFKQRFPSNNNIEAKIRQQLQILEKMELIEHVAAGRWRKK